MVRASLRGFRSGLVLAVTAGLLAALVGTARAADPPKPGDKVTEMVEVINKTVKQGWADNKIEPSKVCSDTTFIRRASLDIVGRIATPAEIAEFAIDKSSDKRAKLIERLLKHEDYNRHWASMWANWLLTRSGAFGGRSSYHAELEVWLEDKFALNTPYNQLVTKLLTAKGKNTENPEVVFLLAHVGEATPAAERTKDGHFDMVPITSRVTRLFLGTQTQCAQCHDHPFDGRIKQGDYWGINAFLRQVERKGMPPMPNQNNQNMGRGPMLELVINTSNNPEGLVTYEKRNGVFQATKPSFRVGAKTVDELGLKPANLKEDRRDELAKFLIDHPMFGKAYVNRMWGHFLGRGIVNPVDDFNEQNTATHLIWFSLTDKSFRSLAAEKVPEAVLTKLNPLKEKEFATKDQFGKELENLLSPDELTKFKSVVVSHATQELLGALGEKFAHYGYDMKNVIRWICNSEPYQLSSVANKTNNDPTTDPFFSRMQLKVMSPEELFESISKATATDMTKEDKKAARDRWMQNLVANFGDDEGNEVSYNGTVVQALLMMNGTDLNAAVSDGNGLVAKLMTKYKVNNNNLTSAAQGYIINDIYLATLNRQPNDKERSAITNAMTLLRPVKLPNGKEAYQAAPDKEVAHRFQDLLWAILNSNEFMLNH